MTIRVVLFGNLARLLPDGSSGNSGMVSVEDGVTVDGMLDGLGVPHDSRGYVLLNGARVKPDAPLEEADEVRVIVPLCGG